MVSVRNKKNYPLIMIKYSLSSRGPKGYTIERSFFFGLSLCGRHSYEGWSGGAKVLGKLPMRGVLLIWIIVGQGPTALAVGAGWVVWTFFSRLSFLSSFSLSLRDGPI